MDRVYICGCRSGIASIMADMCPVHLKAERFSEVPDKILSALLDICFKTNIDHKLTGNPKRKHCKKKAYS